ncbi:helix-turn-helix domain-containing protein [Actinocrispum wychmicini]|uniref:helix-turn-helix domain-containing protein n=1 Tax=Actinocrispum wychmicini TaxID=1213861 RepID=UPI001404D260|nr:helix-turn-helix domain-containing protein [Actinocrispum wychmicini]
MTEPTFGSLLRKLREETGMSQRALAGKIFRDHSRISRLESGDIAPTVEYATLLDEVFGTAPTLTAIAREVEAGAQQARRRKSIGRRSELPPVPANLLGRSTEVAAIVDRLRPDTASGSARSVRVCLIYGIAGIGKTALAAVAADRLREYFPDGQLYLDLYGYATNGPGMSVEEALEALLIQLDAPGGSRRAGRSKLVADLRTQVSELRLLVVLENVPDAEQVRLLTSALPGSTVIVTSRSRLTAPDEVCRVALGVLPFEDAEDLFRLIAGPRANGAPGDGTLRPQIRNIVRMCYRLPLGIHLIATRFRDNTTFTLDDIESALTSKDTRLDEIGNGEQSLAEVLAASHALLPERERSALAGLSVHPGVRINRYSAAVLLETSPREADGVLNSLLRSSMVADHSSGAYEFHDPIRDFVRHGPVGVVLTDRERRRLLHVLFNYYLSTAAAAELQISPHRIQLDLSGVPESRFGPVFDSAQAALRWIGTEQENLLPLCREMLNRDFAETCWQFCYYLRGYFYTTMRWASWVPVFRLGVQAAVKLGQRGPEGLMLNNLGLALAESGEPDEAARYHLAAQAAFEAAGDRPGQAVAEGHYGWAQYLRRDYGEAYRSTAKALSFFRANGTDWHVATTLESLAHIAGKCDDKEQAAACFREAGRIFRELALSGDAARMEDQLRAL